MSSAHRDATGGQGVYSPGPGRPSIAFFYNWLMGFRIASALALILLLGNVIASAQPSPRQVPTGEKPQKPEEKLPEGEGREILRAACSVCHAVSEVTKFAGTYGRDEWRDLVKSMIVYGAQVTAEEEEILVDYLDMHFGKD